MCTRVVMGSTGSYAQPFQCLFRPAAGRSSSAALLPPQSVYKPTQVRDWPSIFSLLTPPAHIPARAYRLTALLPPHPWLCYVVLALWSAGLSFFLPTFKMDSGEYGLAATSGMPAASSRPPTTMPMFNNGAGAGGAVCPLPALLLRRLQACLAVRRVWVPQAALASRARRERVLRSRLRDRRRLWLPHSSPFPQ